LEELYVEYLEDMIESNRLSLSPDGEAVMRVEHLEDGTEIFLTGDPIIDEYENQFKAQVLRAIAEEKRTGTFQKSSGHAITEPSTSWYENEDMLKE